METFDIFFKTFITFESFTNVTQLLEFNIDVSFINSQNIVKDFQGFVYEIEHCQYMIPIQIESFATLDF